jgi:hypothetical protein
MVYPERFDELALAVATDQISRRRMLKMLAATVVGGGGLLLSANPAQARCQRVGRRCGGGRRCCSGARCAGGRCVCKEGFTNCGGRCRDLNNSRNHCGTCFNECLSNEVCQSGDCCRPSFTLCTDVCAAGSNCSACCSGFCFGDNTC